ncbi:SAP domain-containing protein [Streptomyces chartreusis]|uniref:SAP domain-containing protein n=1 Tax=Streptomyces chartreusis TaxID=1969 RepID=UPI0035D983E8
MTPKITVHGGASNAGAEPEPVDETDEAAGEDVSTEDSTPVSDTPPGPGYEDWTVDQLKEELAKRDLPRSGKRDDLVQRLRDDDATAETE